MCNALWNDYCTVLRLSAVVGNFNVVQCGGVTCSVVQHDVGVTCSVVQSCCSAVQCGGVRAVWCRGLGSFSLSGR